MIAVVERGTARAASGNAGTLTIAGKTGTAQNPHGPAHGWFIGFAPADKPEIVVGAIVEFAREGPYVAPLVARTITHYLGIEDSRTTNIRVVLPADSAPAPFQVPAIPQDTVPRIPVDSVVARPPTR
jgi:membrane peptidoglycan carboxypeptidase